MSSLRISPDADRADQLGGGYIASMAETSAPPGVTRSSITFVIALTLLMSALVFCHVKGVNGPEYWTWPWRRLPMFPLYVVMLLAAIPFVAAQYLYPKRLKTALLLLAISTFALQLTAVACQPPGGLTRLTSSIRHIHVTSYYADALAIHEGTAPHTIDWLRNYTDALPHFQLHSRFKPPGLILYYLFWIKLLGTGTAGVMGAALGIAGMASLVPIACYRLTSFFTVDRDAAFSAASFVTLCPSLLLFFPQFDQVYPVLVCAILVSWGMAARTAISGPRSRAARCWRWAR